MVWKYEIINDISYEWADFMESAECKHVFYHPSLVKSWIETYQPLRHIKPFLVQATDGYNVALLPMAVWNRNWKNAFLKSIIPIGYSDFDYHDPIFKFQPSETSIYEFWQGLIAELTARFKYDTFTTDGITDSAVSSDKKWQPGEICPYLKLDNIKDENELMAFFKTSLRGDIRRQIRRLEEIAPLEYKEYSCFEEIAPETFKEFMRQHSNRWPKAYKAPNFHENLLKDGLKSDTVHFSTLSVGKNEIAWHLGFSYNGRYYYYMPAGNQNFFKFSPTKIHLFYLVRRAVELGYSVFDHLRGEENYKAGWSNDFQHVSTLDVHNRSFISNIKHNLIKLRR